VLRYRNLDFYQAYTDRGIDVRALFTLDDLAPQIKRDRGRNVNRLTDVPTLPTGP